MSPLEAEKVAGGNDAASRSLSGVMRQQVCDGEGLPSDLRIAGSHTWIWSHGIGRRGEPRRIHPS